MGSWKEGDRGTKLAVPFRVKADVETRIVKGHASVFNVIDRQGDMVVPGAFQKTIQKRFIDEQLIKMIWQHDPREPMGVPMILREDQKGLYFEVKVTETDANLDRLKLMADRVVDRVSIGFNVVKFEEFEDDEARAALTGWAKLFPLTKLKELELVEFSPVTFASNEKAEILSVKSTFGWVPTFGTLPDIFMKERVIEVEPDVVPEHKQAAVEETKDDSPANIDEPDDVEPDTKDDEPTADEPCVLTSALGDFTKQLKRDRQWRALAGCATQLTSSATRGE